MYLRVSEVAKMLDVHPKTIENWIKSGELKALKFSRAVRIAEADLKQFLENHRK